MTSDARCLHCSGPLPSPGGSCPRCAGRVNVLERCLPSRYEPLARIGTGRLGDVYRCRDTEAGREVVVKVLPPETCADRDAMYVLRRNLPLVTGLAGHPHILRYHGFEPTDTGVVLVLEFAPGGTLRDRLRSGLRFSEEECRRIGAQVAGAFSVVHQRELLLQVRPQNVLFDSEENVRVDFDLARVVPIPGGTVPDGADYLAPEELACQRIQATKDIYALGCLLHHMATGQPPFIGNAVKAIHAKMTELPPDPRGLRADLSESFAAVVRKCLATRAEDRPPDGEACVALFRTHS